MEPNAPDTSNFLDWVEIKNFKSIKDLRLDCKRVNILIGKPNVGKSNILEALGMLGADYSVGKFMDSVRYNKTSDLFYDNDVKNDIVIQTSSYKATLVNFNLVNDICRYQFWNYFDKLMSDYFIDLQGAFEHSSVDEDLKHKIILSPVKKYDFINMQNFSGQFGDFLLPPFGRNLSAVINKYDDLFDEIASLFEEQGLQLILSERDQTFLLQKKEGMRVKQYPFFAIADTFRRFMFYITAIESNANSVIVFEEPEVHSFPPYTQELAYRMIEDEDNQYFISTHSPYMLHPFIEKMPYKDLNVFITYYENYQTRVKALDYEEFRDILDYSTNVFFNLNHFTPDATNKVAP